LWIGIGELANKLPESSVLAAKTALLACNGNVEEAVKVLSVGFNIRSAKRKRTT
jgi:translation elongation factor EF-Ts